MGENLKRTYILDFFTRITVEPVGTVNVFGTMNQESLTNYEARLSVMDMTVFMATNAADSKLSVGEVALMFMRHFTDEGQKPERCSPAQGKWYATGTASKYAQVVEGINSLVGFEYTPSASAE